MTETVFTAKFSIGEPVDILDETHLLYYPALGRVIYVNRAKRSHHYHVEFEDRSGEKLSMWFCEMELKKRNDLEVV